MKLEEWWVCEVRAVNSIVSWISGSVNLEEVQSDWLAGHGSTIEKTYSTINL